MSDPTQAREPLPDANLTHDEALARAGRVADVDYLLSIDLPGGEDAYSATATVTFASRPGEGAVFLDFVARELTALRLDGDDLDPACWNGTRLTLPEDKAGEGEHTLEVEYVGALERRGMGFHRFLDPEDGGEYVYTNLEPYEAHRVFPCFDQPDIKASYTLTVEAPAEWKIISNTRQDDVETHGDRQVHHFPTTKRFSTYLFNLTAGPYVEFEDEDARIPSRLFCRPTVEKYFDPGRLFALTEAGFDFYEKAFEQPYPFTKYDQVFAPEFMTGAMENVGAVLWNDSRYVHRQTPSQDDLLEQAMVLLHEMAHMWFGNLVTMRWWDGLWLNESFATWVSFVACAEATEYGEEAWVYFDAKLRAWAMWQDRLPTTHAIQMDIPETKGAFSNFDGITYGKGCCVLRQLAHTLGEDTFMKGVAHYFRKHAWGNTSNHDFLAALGEIAGRDLDEWARLWLDTPGLTAIEVERPESAGQPLRLRQRVVSGEDVPRPHRLRVALFHPGEDGHPDHVSVEAELDGAEATVELPELPGDLRFVHPNHHGYAYGAVRLDEASTHALVEDLPRVEPPPLRSTLVDTLRQMLVTARMPAREFLEAAEAVMESEAYPPILESLAASVPSCLATFLPEGERQEHAAAVRARADRQLAAMEPETPGASAWFRILVAACRDDEGFALLGALLDGATEYPVLSLEQPLRWRIVQQLVAQGAPGAWERYRTEVERDPSDQGQLQAVTIRAARPDADAKQEAWADFVSEADHSLEFRRASYAGFHRSDQAELTEPYVSKYLEVLPEVTGRRSEIHAITFARGLFPAYAQAEDFGERVEALVDGGELSRGVSRALIECLDDWRRVKRVQALR